MVIKKTLKKQSTNKHSPSEAVIQEKTHLAADTETTSPRGYTVTSQGKKRKKEQVAQVEM